jgi:hypothetical protein
MTTTNVPKAKRFSSNLEKILIALIFISILIYYVATGERELKTGNLFSIVLLLESLLLFYYIYLCKDLYSVFLGGFILLNIGLYGQKINYSLGQNLILAGEITEFFFGIFLSYKTIKESLANKDWEMFSTLVAVALLFPLVYHYTLKGNQEYYMVYNFALAFILGTIIYNENLWDKYNNSEKKILTYILISTIAEVLFISVKLL